MISLAKIKDFVLKGKLWIAGGMFLAVLVIGALRALPDYFQKFGGSPVPPSGSTSSSQTFVNVTSTNGYFTTLLFGNATGTNLYAANASFGNLLFSAASIAGLTWTNGTGTNTTSTNLFATNIAWVSATGSIINLNSAGNITTAGVDSFATLTLAGGSGAITATAPIPTSTTLITGSFPEYTFAMDATNTNCIYWGPVWIRDAWNAGTMNPRLQFTNVSGTGDTIWSLRAQSVANSDYMGAPFSAAKSYATGTVGVGYTATNTIMTALTVGGAAAGTPMKFELCREGSHGQDSFGGTAYPNSVKIEYGINKYSD